jgi:hypothetical protein
MNEQRPGLGHGQSPHITPAAAPHSPGIHPHPQPAVHHGTHPPQHGVLHGAGPVPTMKKPTVIDEPIELEADDLAAPTKSKIVAFGDHATHAAHDWKRSSHKNQTGAVRVRSFHCRLSEQGLEYMDNAINEWLDHHPDIEIKFTSSVVGLFDGKIKEPALILNLWY